MYSSSMKRHCFFYTVKTYNNTIIFLLYLFILTSPQITMGAEKYLTDTKKEFITRIQTDIYLDNFQTAHDFSDSLISLDKNDPIGYLFKAAVYLSEMTDTEENLYPLVFKNLIDTVILLGEKNITAVDSNSSAWNCLAVGHARAYRSLYESRFGSMTSALKNGFKAKSAYQDGLNYDSSVYDIYGGLGMYHYWKSAKAGFLRSLRIFNDDRQKGIDELYLTIDSSEISADAARSSLIWIYLDKEQFDTAAVIAQKMYQKYPEGKIFLWALAQIYFQSEQFDKAVETYQFLLEKLTANPKNYFNIVECEYRIYEADIKNGNTVKAKKTARRFMTFVNKIPQKTRERQKDKIEILVKEANS